MADIITGRESYRGDQLAVELHYVPYFLDELETFGTRWRVADRNEALRLALLEPEQPGAALITDRAADRPAMVARARALRHRTHPGADPGTGGEDPPDLDVVLAELRDRARQRYQGWPGPAIGKVRLVHDVHGSPHIGGDGDPVQATPEEAVLPPRSPRARPIRLGVLDSGMYDHPALRGRYLVESDAALPARPPDWTAAQGHATFMVGVALQKAPDAEVVVRSVLDRLGTASSWEVAKKMVAFRGAVDVLSMSFAATTPDGERPLILGRAVEYLDPEVVMVAADENRPGPSAAGRPDAPAREALEPYTPGWPAACHEVIGVGADDQDGKNAPFSPDLPWISLRALGVQVPSAFLEGRVRFVRLNQEGQEEDHGGWTFDVPYARWNGCSIATAKVAGAIAAIASDDGVTAREAAAALLDPPARRSPAYERVTADIRVP
ncbi:S8 family peptidase [Actinomadura fibrosa]|uniref:S8 family serine peptidase n=1 Tax=Actinomadura fibrosa TaxID=111802 RepID=A0ABW2XPJ0_9ACTN|nr:S8/S53 family peptidase [Actinomadura fibrosa]